jgi:N-acyl-D-amino-acid deacylase
VGISGGKIALIRRWIDVRCARRVISAKGLVVCPGFFDTHTHDDLYLLFNPRCDEKVLQGVTTVVIGNCGFSVGPICRDRRDLMAGFLRLMGGQYVNEEDLRIESFGDYLGKLQAAEPGINIIPLVGHSTVRLNVMGSEDRAPTEEELRRMRAMVARAMEEGAWGLSTGLIYAPGNYARTEEIVELAREVARFQGIYASHIRNEGSRQLDAIAEAIRIGEEAGVRVHIAHHKIAGRSNWGMSRRTLAMMRNARAKGLEVTCDQYPYRAGSTFLAALLPPAVLAGGDEVFSHKLKDPGFRREVVSMMESDEEEGWENLVKGGGFDGIFISVSQSHPDYVGRSIAEIAEAEGKDPYDVLLDLIAEERRGIIAILFMMDEGDIRRIMRGPFVMVGSDGIPSFGVNKVHPRFAGTFPRVLGRYVRQRKVLTLEEAVRKMTSLPAQTFGVRGKGLLKEGFDADIVVFDPETVIDGATYHEPHLAPEGIPYVLVNGQLAVERGEVVGAASGRVLRR